MKARLEAPAAGRKQAGRATHIILPWPQFCQICHGVRCLSPPCRRRYSRAPSLRLSMRAPRFAVFALAVAAALWLAAAGIRPALAQENSLFTVANVHVDASGASSTEALNAAIAQGRAKAFQILYRRLTRQADWGRQPALDAAGLQRLGRGYSIANER